MDVVMEGTTEERQQQEREKLLAAIRDQLEFYFGDSNLSKDRYLGKLLADSTDKFVDINVLLSFHRLKQLTTSVQDIIAAVRTSTFIKLNDSLTHIGRVAPFQPKENTDDQTIYAEHFLPKVDHDFLRAVFSRFGKVEYVSLPRFEHSRMPKGFAFIEFSSKEDVNKTINEIIKIQQESDGNAADTIAPAAEEEDADDKNKPAGDDSRDIEQRIQQQLQVIRVMTKKRWKLFHDEYRKHESHCRSIFEQLYRLKLQVPRSFKLNVLVEFSGINGEKCTPSSIKALFAKVAQVEYVDYHHKDNQGIIRLKTPEDANAILESFTKHPVPITAAEMCEENLGNKVETEAAAASMDIDTPPRKKNDPSGEEGEKYIQLQLLTGEKEIVYWKRIKDQQLQRVRQSHRRMGKEEEKDDRRKKQQGGAARRGPRSRVRINIGEGGAGPAAVTTENVPGYVPDANPTHIIFDDDDPAEDVYESFTKRPRELSDEEAFEVASGKRART